MKVLIWNAFLIHSALHIFAVRGSCCIKYPNNWPAKEDIGLERLPLINKWYFLMNELRVFSYNVVLGATKWYWNIIDNYIFVSVKPVSTFYNFTKYFILPVFPLSFFPFLSLEENHIDLCPQPAANMCLTLLGWLSSHRPPSAFPTLILHIPFPVSSAFPKGNGKDLLN